jgi:thiamine biosynthesis protein ThiC
MKLENFCTRKDTIISGKRQTIRWEKVFTNCTSDIVLSKIYKEFNSKHQKQATHLKIRA